LTGALSYTIDFYDYVRNKRTNDVQHIEFDNGHIPATPRAKEKSGFILTEGTSDMTRIPRFPPRAVLVFLILCMTGCASTFGWVVHTTSTPFSSTSHQYDLWQEKLAVLTPLTSPGLRGNEAGLGQSLTEVIKKMAPGWDIMDDRKVVSLINGQGLAAEFIRMRSDAEQSHILDRESLQKIGQSIGVRYVFQPRLAYFTQDTESRWTVPAINLRLIQTQVSTMRLTLQLWDTTSGELLWTSAAEANMQKDTFSQTPVFLEENAKIALASMLTDLLDKKTSSKYTPVNRFIHKLMDSNDRTGSELGNKQEKDQDAKQEE
jgi:hypothetical protein